MSLVHEDHYLDTLTMGAVGISAVEYSPDNAKVASCLVHAVSLTPQSASRLAHLSRLCSCTNRSPPVPEIDDPKLGFRQLVEQSSLFSRFSLQSWRVARERGDERARLSTAGRYVWLKSEIGD